MVSMSTAGSGSEVSSAAHDGVLSRPARIVIVDEEVFTRDILVRKLRAQGYVCDSCSTSQEALLTMGSGECDLLLADITMPRVDGMELIREAQKVCPGVAVVLVTSVANLEVAVEALKHGAYDYIKKPFSLEEVTIAVARALEKRRLVLENQQYRRTLEDQVAGRTLQLKEALDVLQSTYRSTLLALSTALDKRETGTGWHSLRVMKYTTRLGREMGLNAEELRNLEQGALLHDIGKLGVPDALLCKEEALSEDEWALMRRHPVIGYQILAGIKFLQGAALMVLHHHERYDGTGYPGGLSGEDIALEARIFAVADALDCMTSDRSFQGALTFEAARDELHRCAGTQFDPKIVEAFLRVPVDDWKDLQRVDGMPAARNR
jgi:putative two-component system response regulator